MKTLFLPTLIFVGLVQSHDALSQMQYGYETFPTENGKYREIATRHSTYGAGSPPAVLHTDSTLTTYKNGTTNAIDKRTVYRQKDSGEWYPFSESTYAYDTTANHTSMSVTFTIDMDESGLKNDGRSTFQRDRNSSRLLMEMRETWEEASTSYKNVDQTKYFYDNAGRVITEENYKWLTTEWQPTSKDTYVYDGNSNRVLTMIHYINDPMPPYTEFMYNKKEYSYDSNTNLITEEHYTYNQSGQEWNINEKYSYQYSGTQLNKVLREKPYTDTDGNPALYVWREWNLTYNSDNQLTEQILSGVNTQGQPQVNYNRYTHTYDASGFLETTLFEFYSLSSGQWENDTRQFYTYNDGSYFTESKQELWSTSDNAWRLQMDNRYYYQKNDNGYIDVIFNPNPGSNVSIDDVAVFSVNIFPNPTQTELTVRYDIEENVQFQIVSINGQLAKSGQLQHGIDNKISLIDMPNGHYILQLNSSTITANSHFVKTGE